jgi:hypothetical protein
MSNPDANIAKILLACISFVSEAIILSQIVYYSNKQNTKTIDSDPLLKDEIHETDSSEI